MTVPRTAALGLIGLFKLTKGCLLAAVALELAHLGPEATSDALIRWATRLHVDPDGRSVGRVIEWIAGLGEHRLRAVGAGLLAYGALFLTEGIGLLLRQRWAEYVTLVVTASFIPLELYEITRHPDWVRVAVALVNVGIAWYLARGLRRRQDGAQLARRPS